MAWQSGYGGSVSFGTGPGFGTGVDWADVIMSVTHWHLRTGFQMHEVPYIGMTYDTPPLVNGFSRWVARVAFLLPIELTTDSMRVDGADVEWTPYLKVNANDYWAAKGYLVTLETTCPLDGPTSGIATLRGIEPMKAFGAS